MLFNLVEEIEYLDVQKAYFKDEAVPKQHDAAAAGVITNEVDEADVCTTDLCHGTGTYRYTHHPS